MKSTISIYSLYHFLKRTIIIDLILLFFFLISIVLTIKLSDPTKEFDYSSLFLNLSASFLSIWITVRLIDNLKSKREKLRQARIQLIGNLKHPFEYISRFYPKLDERDLEYLKREINWFDKKWIKLFSYTSILKNNEESIARNLSNFNIQILNDINNVVVGYKLDFKNEEERESEMSWRLKELSKKMREIEIEIENLTIEVWKTDKPISI